VHRFLSGWPGNSVELAHEPATGTTVALIIDSRVDWTRPRYNAVFRTIHGEAANGSAGRMLHAVW
jgi:hypothetical protein